MRLTRKTLLARFDTVARLINSPQFIAVILQIMRPPPEPGSDFQNGASRQTLANPWKNCSGPLRGRAAPRFRPFLARLSPIVFHRMEHKFMASKTDQIRVVDDVMMEEFTSQCSRKKAMRKRFNKAINKRGLDVAQHFTTALAAAKASYLRAAERTQLKNGQDYSRRQRNPESGAIEHFVLERQP